MENAEKHFQCLDGVVLLVMKLIALNAINLLYTEINVILFVFLLKSYSFKINKKGPLGHNLVKTKLYSNTCDC